MARTKIWYVSAVILSVLGCLHLRGIGISTDLVNASFDDVQSYMGYDASGQKYAYMSFLGSDLNVQEHGEPAKEDTYFTMIRMLAYMLLHDPATRTTHSYPFIVLVTENVTQDKRDRLTKDGATVVEVPVISAPWITTHTARWREQLAKLNLFKMEEYDKILFVDGDTLLYKSLDGVFADPATNMLYNLNNTAETAEDESEQPLQYMLAGTGGAGGFQHTYPIPAKSGMNGGFFVARPSLTLFEHYMSVIEIEGRFPTKYMEQALLNYVHRRSGNLPWAQLDWKWNTNWAVFNDTRNGLFSLHSKYFETDFDPELHDFALSKRWAMEGYFQHLDSVTE